MIISHYNIIRTDKARDFFRKKEKIGSLVYIIIKFCPKGDGYDEGRYKKRDEAHP